MKFYYMTVLSDSAQLCILYFHDPAVFNILHKDDHVAIPTINPLVVK